MVQQFISHKIESNFVIESGSLSVAALTLDANPILTPPPPTEGLTAIMAFFGSDCVSETRRAREGPLGCLHCKQKAVFLGMVERSIYSCTHCEND